MHKHETAEKLYCELIDVGEGEPRPIASGLVQHYSLEELSGRKVVVVCNLPPRKLVGFKSHGMVLCAVGEDGSVELLRPPDDAKPGDRVSVDNHFNEPLSAKQCDKRDAWKRLSPLFKVRDGVGFWNQLKLVTAEGGECTTQKVTHGELG